MPRNFDISWLWESLRVVMSHAFNSDPRGRVQIPGLPETASALSSCSKLDLTNFLISTFFTSRHGHLERFKMQLVRWLSQPYPLHFLKTVLSANISKYKHLQEFTWEIIRLGNNPSSNGSAFDARGQWIQVEMDLGTAAVLFETLLSCEEITSSVKAVTHTCELTLSRPLPDVIARLIEKGADIKKLDKANSGTTMTQTAFSCLQSPKLTSLLLKNGAQPGSGLLPAMATFLELLKEGKDTSQAETLLYWLLSHGANPNRITTETYPLAVGEYAQSQSSRLGYVFGLFITDRISCEIRKIYVADADEVTLRDTSQMAKDLVLLATIMLPRNDHLDRRWLKTYSVEYGILEDGTGAQLPINLKLMRYLLANGANPNRGTSSCSKFVRGDNDSTQIPRNIELFGRYFDNDEPLDHPIAYACEMWDADAVCLLLEAGCSLPWRWKRTSETFKDPDNSSSEDWPQFDVFMQRVASCLLGLRRVNFRPWRTWILHWGLVREDLEVISQFCDHGLDLNEGLESCHDRTQLDDPTPMTFALRQCTFAFVEGLWSLGARFRHFESQAVGTYELVDLCYQKEHCANVHQKISFLLGHGAQVNATSSYVWAKYTYAKTRKKRHERMTPLQAVCNEPRDSDANLDSIDLLSSPQAVEILQQLMSHGADVNAAGNRQHRTPFQMATESGNLDLMRLLWTNGADINLTQGSAWSPSTLICAPEWPWARGRNTKPSIQSKKEILQELISQGMNINTIDEGGFSPLYVACTGGALQLPQFLIAKGADVNLAINLCEDPDRSYIPLEAACQISLNSTVDLALLLLQNGAHTSKILPAKLQAVDRGLCEAIIAHDIAKFKERFASLVSSAQLKNALRMSRLEDLRDLIERGADVNVFHREDKGKGEVHWETPLEMALRDNDYAAVLLLVENGANCQAMDRSGRTPLGWAIERGSYAMVRLLLNAGAGKGLRTQRFEDSISMANKKGFHEILELLCEYDVGQMSKVELRPVFEEVQNSAEN